MGKPILFWEYMSGSHHTLQIPSRVGAKTQWCVGLELQWIRKIFPNVNEKNRRQVWKEVDKMTGSLGYGSALLSEEQALSNSLVDNELFSWGRFKWAARSPQIARPPHAREPAPPPPLLLPVAGGWNMWGSCGRREPGILQFIYLTTLLAWAQLQGFPFTWSANWISVPAQSWSTLRGPRSWPWPFHSKYVLDARVARKNTWEQCSQYLACIRTTL